MEYKYVAVLHLYNSFHCEIEMEYVVEEYHIPVSEIDGDYILAFQKGDIVSDITNNLTNTRTVTIKYDFRRKEQP